MSKSGAQSAIVRDSYPSRRKPCRPMTAETSSAYLRRLGTWDAAAIVIGGVIGAGIFRSASTVAERTS